MGRGQTDTHTDTQTLQLLDRTGPVGRFGEKKHFFDCFQLVQIMSSFIYANLNHIN